MRKYLVMMASAAALGFSGTALADEATTTPMGPVQMTDAELDGVTAAGATVTFRTPPPGVNVFLPQPQADNAVTRSGGKAFFSRRPQSDNAAGLDFD